MAERLRRGDRVPVIIELRPGEGRSGFTAPGLLGSVALRAQESEIGRVQAVVLGRLAGLPVGNVKQYRTIPYLALQVESRGFELLGKLAEVATIREDRIRHISLAESVPLIGAPAAWAAGYRGAGQTIAILDTGVDKTHPFLAGKVVSEACYSTTGSGYTSVCPGGVAQSTASGSGVNCTVDGCEHGTHVAGIAAGTSASFSGVARDASLIAVQVFSRVNNCTSDCTGAFDSDILLGLQRVYDLRTSHNIAAVNMSLGGGSSSTNCDADDPAMKAAVDTLRSVGIATVVAAGNEGTAGALSWPACISSTISVGSTGDGSSGATANVVSGFSNSSSFLNLLAPGQWITSSVPGGTYSAFAGTSMAAPHVAGAWAVMKSKTPSATVSQVLQAFNSTGLGIVDMRNGITRPRIRVDQAVGALATTGCDYALSPAAITLDRFGGGATITITAGAGCSWTAQSNNSWITVTSGSSGSGSGAVTVTVEPNTSVSRTGTLFIGGQTYVVSQDGVPVFIVDDGGFEDGLGLGGNGGIYYGVNRLTPPSYPTTIDRVAIYFSNLSGVNVGDELTVLAAVNPGGAATIDGLQFQQTVARVQAIDQFNIFTIPGLTATAGDFVVGLRFAQSGSVFPFELDTTQPRGRSYTSTNGTNFTLVDSSYPGNFGIRALQAAGLQCLTVSAIAPTSAVAGAVVTISGSGFTGLTSVTFAGGVAGAFTVNSDTSLTVTVPANIVSGRMMLTKPGCGEVATGVFTVSGPSIVAEIATLTAENCPTPNQTIDPDETVTVSLALRNAGSVATTNLVATLPYGLGVMGPSGPQSYGVLAPGGAAVSRSFTFTANRACGSELTLMLALQDGATNLGTVSRTFGVGVTRAAMTQNFDGVSIPTLPSGWSSTRASGTSPQWVTSIGASDSAPNSAFISNPTTISDIRLDSPVFTIVSAAATLSFRHSFNLESGFDGGVLEVSIGGGAYTDIISAGGSFLSGGYGPVIAAGYGSPIGGRQAWSGNSGGFIQTVVGLPAAAAGQNVSLRWRMGADSSVGRVGWYVDTISVADGFSCTTGCSVIPCPTLDLSPTSLPNGTAAGSYSQTLTAGGGIAPYAMAITAGSLPPGLSLSSSGVAAGTPTQAGTFSATVTVADANGCARAVPLSMTIDCPTLSLLPSSLPNGAVQTPYSQTFAASPAGGAYFYAISAGSLPAGLTLDGLTGALTGIPTAVGIFNFTVSATGFGSCSVSQSLSLTIDCSVVTISPAALPNAAEAAVYNQPLTVSPGGGYSYALSEGTLPPGLTLDATSGTISGTATTAGVSNFTITASGPGSCQGTRSYTLTTTPPLEADVSPRSGGNGKVDVSDWVQVGRFVVGLDSPAAGAEFRRVDIAPRNTKGDAVIDVSDWVQAGRYAVGLDPLEFIAGPDQIALAPPVERRGSTIRAVESPEPTASNAPEVSFVIEIVATGRENALGFTLRFEPREFELLGFEPLSPLTLLVNRNEDRSGQIGIAAALPPGESFLPGTHRLLRLRFRPASGAGSRAMPVWFDDSLVRRKVVTPGALPLGLPEFPAGLLTSVFRWSLPAAGPQHDDHETRTSRLRERANYRSPLQSPRSRPERVVRVRRWPASALL